MNLRKEKLYPGQLVQITGVEFTKGKIGEVAYFDKAANKWLLYFDGGWQGWYTREQFKLIGE